MPKAAVKKHLQMVISGLVGGWAFDVNEDSIYQQNLPLFHFSGLLNSCMAMGRGAQLILTPKFSASGAVEAMKKHNSTHMTYIGEVIRFINQVPEKADDKVRDAPFFATDTTFLCQKIPLLGRSLEFFTYVHIPE